MKFSILTYSKVDEWLAADSSLVKRLPEVEKKLQAFDADLKCRLEADKHRICLEGKKIKGSLVFRPLLGDEDAGSRDKPYQSCCEVELKLPLMWSAFKSKIQASIEKLLQK